MFGCVVVCCVTVCRISFGGEMRAKVSQMTLKWLKIGAEVGGVKAKARRGKGSRKLQQSPWNGFHIEHELQRPTCQRRTTRR